MNAIRQYFPFIVLIVLLTAAALVLGVAGDVRVLDDFAFKKELPAAIGEWHGEDILFCQNEQCLKSYPSGAGQAGTCPACGSPLVLSWSLAEKNLLPPGTLLLKKQYTDNSGKIITVTIVVAGGETTGIHRPQICLAGQGYQITGQKNVDVPLEGRRALSVRMLDIVLKRPGKDGSVVNLPGVFTYWYAGGGRETSDNFARSYYMLVDRILFGRSSRWAYVSVVTSRSGPVENEMISFIKRLYPAISAGQE